MSHTIPQTDVAIIGAGPAGLFAVFELGLLGLSAHVIDALPTPGGQCVELYGDKTIYDIPGIPAITGHALTQQLLQQIQPWPTPMHLGQVVETLERVTLPDGADGFLVRTDQSTELTARAVLVAAGVGAFMPRKLPLAALQAFEGQHIFYHPQPTERWVGRNVLILGDDEAALSWAFRLSPTVADGYPHKAKHVTVLHRRDRWRAPDAMVEQLHQLHQQNALTLVLGQITDALVDPAHGTLTGVNVLLSTSHDGTEANPSSHRQMPVDVVLPLLGLSPKLGPISDWDLNWDHKHIPVSTSHFETSSPGVYAIGDIVYYPGKRKLILSGFHEATLAAYAIAEKIKGTPPPTLYTTSHRALQEQLQRTHDKP